MVWGTSSLSKLRFGLLAWALIFSGCSLDNSILGSFLNTSGPQISIDNVSVVEGDTLNFTLSLSALSDQDVSVKWRTLNGTATTADADYTTVPLTTATIPAGSLTLLVSAVSTQDLRFEVNEIFTITLTNPVNGELANRFGLGTITNDDTAPDIFVSDASVLEGETAQVVVSLSEVSGAPVVFVYQTFDDEATQPADYVQVIASTRTIPTGSLSLLIPVVTVEDTTDESNEVFLVSLSGVTNATIATPGADDLAEVTITDDDNGPPIFIVDTSVTEGGTLIFAVTLAAISAQGVTFDFTTFDGTATTANSDYTTTSASGTILAGALTTWVAVETTVDSTYESNEALVVSLSNLVNATSGDLTASGTITNDDTAPDIFVSDVSANEGETLYFSISLSVASGANTTVEWSTADNTATLANSDYTQVTTTVVTIPAGALSVVVNVVTTQDTVYEANELLYVNLANVTGATLVDNQGSGTITNEDLAPTIKIYDLTVAEGSTANFAISLSALSGVEVVFSIETFDDTATAGLDYTALALTTLTIPAYQASVIQAVATIDDADTESPETFTASLSAITGATLATASDDLGTATINSDDGSVSIFVSDAAAVTEGETSFFVISLSGTHSQDVTFSYQTYNDTTTAGQDYTAVSLTAATIPIGSISMLVAVVTTDDVLDEAAAEYFTLSLSSVGNANVGDAIGAASVNDNDAAPTIFISDASTGEGTTFTFIVSLSALSGLNVDFSFDTFDDTATSGADYTASSGAGQITIGSLTTSIQVVTAQDTAYEGNETLLISLSALVNAQVGDLLATGTITDDDAAPGLYVSDAETVEGGTLQFVVTLSAVSALPVTFSYQSYDGVDLTVGGSPATTADSDYTAVTGTDTIGAGALAITISVVTDVDTTYEGMENLSLTISSPLNASVVDSTGLGFIHNDDCPTTGWCQQAYLKAADPVASDNFGWSSAIHNDTIVIGAMGEDSGVSGVTNGTGDLSDSGAFSSGAAYVFKRTGATWVQEAMLKAADPVANDNLGFSSAIDVDTIVLGANSESSSISGVVNGTGGFANTSATFSGAAYVFKRTGNTWVQEAALKGAAPTVSDNFARSISVRGDTIVVGASGEDSAISGVTNGTGEPAGAGALGSGAAYVFKRTGTTWVQEAALKAPDPVLGDQFGYSVAISSETIVVGSNAEDSNISGVINGTGGFANTSSSASGAAYVFKRTGTTWVQQAALKAADPGASNAFGTSGAIDGDTIVIGAVGEGSSLSGVVNGTGGFANTSATTSGAAYVFKRTGDTWVQEAAFKAADPATGEEFGYATAVQGDRIVVAANRETSYSSMVINGTGGPVNNAATSSGAAYVFKRTGTTWFQEAALKASDATNTELFGNSVDINGDTIVVGSFGEDSNAAGVINGPYGSTNTSLTSAGAAYVFHYKGSPSVIIQQATTQADPASSLPIVFTVDFGKVINPATFTSGDITQTGTATGITWTVTDTGDSRHFTLQATAGSDGTYIPTIAAGVVTDGDGNTNLDSSPNFDNSVTYSAPATPSDVYIADAEAVEGQTLLFVVSLAATNTVDVTFNYQSYDGTSAQVGGMGATTADSDYTAISGTGTIPIGSLAITISVVTTQDTSYENLENLSVTLSGGTNANYIDNAGLGFIHNDDCPTTGWCQQAYLKAADPVAGESFGFSSAISGDTVVVGAYEEDSNISGVINGTGGFANTSASDSGAAYVFRRTGTTWVQEAALKAADPVSGDNFGHSSSISGDTIVIGAFLEDSNVSGVTNGTGGFANTSATDSGAAYVFRRTSTTWVQEAALKAADPVANDAFGFSSSSISGDTVVIGAAYEDSSISGVINGTGGFANTSATDSGAAYVFRRTGTTWVQEAALKAADPSGSDHFGSSSSISGDTIVIGAAYENSNISGVSNGTGGFTNSSATDSGAAYIFRRTGATWVQESAIKAPDPVAYDYFGYSSSISGDTVVIGTPYEDSNISGVSGGTGGFANTSALNSGAAYVYRRTGTTWVQEAALKAADPVAGDRFGQSIFVSGDKVVIGAVREASNISGVTNGTGGFANTLAVDSGAAYVFRRTGMTWVQEAALKAADPMTGDYFGISSSISGDTVVIGAYIESSGHSGVINGPWGSLDTSAGSSGAAYVFHYKGSHSVVIEQAPTQADPASALPIVFTVDFGKAITPATFTNADITQGGTATGITWTVTDTGDSRHFTLQATAGSDGTYVPTIAAGVVTDADGNTNLESSPNFDNSVTYNAPGVLYISDSEVVESGTLSFVVSLASSNSKDVSFSFQTFDGSAGLLGAAPATAADSDYTAVNISRTISAGQLAITISVNTTADSTHEGMENLSVTISNPVNASIIDSTGIGIIQNDDCAATGWCQQAFLKPPHPFPDSEFGFSSATDGDTIVIGEYQSSSLQNTITNGTGASSDNSGFYNGAAHVFKRTGATWVQQAYLKAPIPDDQDYFGFSVAIQGDTVLVGSMAESSNLSTIINGTGASSNNSRSGSGAVYVFRRTGATWVQEAFLKAPYPDTNDFFGSSIGISGDTALVTARGEASTQSTITNGTGASSNNGAAGAGAAYVFKRTGTTWVQEAYIKPSNPGSGDTFGFSSSISRDVIIIGATSEDSNQATITNGTGASGDNSNSASGAAYIFRRTGTTWIQEAYLKSPYPDISDQFGRSVAIFENTALVGATGEDSNLTELTNGTGASSNNSTGSAGAAYVFKRTGTTWEQEAFLKYPYPTGNENFGYAVALGTDRAAVSAPGDDSPQSFVTNGTGASTDNSTGDNGAVYIFRRTGTTWVQDAYLKAPNSNSADDFGASLGMNGDTVVVGTPWEGSDHEGIINAPYASSRNWGWSGDYWLSGAAYVFYFKGAPSVVVQQASTQVDPASALPIEFTVDFGKVINPATFTSSDITQNGTATGITWVVTDSGDSRHFTLQATAGSMGTYIPSIAAGVVTDVDGNTNLESSTNYDNSVFYFTNSSLYISDAEVVEGGTLQFVVSITSANVVPVTFSYQSYDGLTSTVGGSPATTADSDYTSVSGTGTLSAGALAVTITSTTGVDTTYEGLENLSVTISNSTNATIVDSAGLGFIHNDDCPTTGWCQQAYLKAGGPEAFDMFGNSSAIYGDLVVVGAAGENSSESGVLNGTGDPSGAAALNSGAAYVFKRTGNTWVQEAVLKTNEPIASDSFGDSVAVSVDTIVVGAQGEDSATIGVTNGTGDPAGTGATDSGAAYVFRRTGNTWVQEAALKAADPVASDYFGFSSSIDQNTIAVSAYFEDSSTTGVLNGTGGVLGTGASDSGAVYVFKRTGNTWVQEAVLKAADTTAGDRFGYSTFVNGDTVVVGSYLEDSATSGVINGTDGASGTGALNAGAAYVFKRAGTTWVQEAFLKAADPVGGDLFGWSVAVSGDSVVVGAYGEDSAMSGVINGTGGPTGTASINSGSAYIYKRTGTTWVQEAALKAGAPVTIDSFGHSVSISGDLVAVGAISEDSADSQVINGTGDPSGVDANASGAAYVFRRTGQTWVQEAAIKAPDTGAGDSFGYSVSVQGDSIVVSTYLEDSGLSGVINGPQGSLSTSASNSGAAYVYYYKGPPSVIIQQASTQSDPTSTTPVVFSVEFSKPINPATFTVGDITQSGTATGVVWNIVNSGDDRHFTLEATALVTAGTIIPTLVASKVADVDGNANGASSTSFDNSVTYTSSTDLFIYDSSATEGSQLTFTVSLTGMIGSDVVFNWATVNGTATGGADFGAGAGTRTIAAGQLSAVITISGAGDSAEEGNEFFQVSLSSVTNASPVDNIGVGVVIDDDVAPSIFISDASVVEGGTAIFTVELNAIYNTNIVINYQTLDVTAASPGDYTAATGTVTITAGALSTTVSVVTLVDTPDSSFETFQVSLATPTAGNLIDDIGVGTITDTGATPTLNIYTTSAVEGGQMQFVVSLNSASSVDVEFQWQTYDGTATGGVDFTSIGATGATITANTMSVTLPVAITQDSAYEGLETILVTISSPVNATITVDNAIGTILDEDCPSTGWCQQAYLKAGDVTAGDQFGSSVSIYGDTVVVGAAGEDSSISGVHNGTGGPPNTSASASGAVYVFKRTGTTWIQEAALKAADPAASDFFGWSISIESDTIVVGATGESSSVAGVLNGTGGPPNISAVSSGAAYVFKRTGTTWVQEAALKAADPVANDSFGYSSSISKDTIVVSAYLEGSSVSGVLNGTGGPSNTSAGFSGAAYVFKRTGTTWVQEAALKAADPVTNDNFGYSSSISKDTIVIGARGESSSVSGVFNGTGGPPNTSASNSGAAYVFKRTGTTWVQEAALKAADPVGGDGFGHSISIFSETIVVGAAGEDSSISGVLNGTGGPANTSASGSGAAYVFKRTGTTWVQEAALKAADPVASDNFGFSISVYGDTILVGANAESSNVSGVINGTGGPANTSASGSGAAYVFKRTGTTWVQEAALKAADPVASDQFGRASALSGDTIVAGALGEDSGLSGVINAPYGSIDVSASGAGAAYVFQFKGPTKVYIQQAPNQVDPTTSMPVDFTVEFSKKIDPASFNTADITQTGTAANVNWTIINSGDDRHYTLRANSVTADGTIIPQIAADSITDVDGQGNLVSSPNLDSSVTKDP